jgi:hypothetical protein
LPHPAAHGPSAICIICLVNINIMVRGKMMNEVLKEWNYSLGHPLKPEKCKNLPLTTVQCTGMCQDMVRTLS